MARRCQLKCRFSSRRTATRDIVSPIFEGLWPSLLDFILQEAFPLAIINLFQPILDGRPNACSSAQGIGFVTSTQHGLV
jgi:hypothetical protein